MREFKNILIAYGWEDTKNTPIERVVRLIREYGAKLAAVCVVEELPQDIRKLPAKISPEELYKKVISNSNAHLKDFVSPIEAAGIEISTDVLAGTPFIEVVRKVLRDRHDLLIIPAHEGLNTAERKLLHTTTIKLLRQCPCPVWVMRAKGADRYRRILAAVDTDPNDFENEQLNMKIMEIAVSMARLEGGEIHVVHAWHLYGEWMLKFSFGHSSSELNAMMDEVKQKHQSSLDKLLSQCDVKDLQVRMHFLRGDAGDLIPGVVAKENIDLMVMGTHSRSGAAGFLRGNTSEKIMHHVDCSVITVKPEQFVAVLA
jgi:universal stress protein E